MFALIDSSVSIHNVLERAVFTAIAEETLQFPAIAGNKALLADVACIALNRLMPRYVVHDVDRAFYATDSERLEQHRLVTEAVRHAFEFLQARIAMGARL